MTQPVETSVQPRGAGHASPQAEGSLKVCVASLGGELFAIDLKYVREVFEVEHVTPVPGMPSTLTGVANLRGTVIPVADLRPALSLRSPATPQKFAIVVRHETQQIGLLVDNVPEIRTVRRDEILTAATGGATNARPFVSSILRIEDRMSGVVEVPTLLTCVETGGGYA
jgi:purine-binding chemotaxis protein CheW